MRIDMVSEHASPLAVPGGTDSGGQNVHVRELALALGRHGHEVTVWTRRDDPGLPARVPLAPGVDVAHLDAGPARQVPKDELIAHVPAMADLLERAWRQARPDVVHAHYWMSGLAALDAAQAVGVPTVQTFHALGSVKRRHQGDDDTSPDGRVAAERSVARRVDRVVATCSDEVFELVRLGAPRRRIRVVPCGVDTAAFTPDGPALERGARPRLVTVGRLVRRKGVDETIAALAAVPDAELVVAGGSGPGDPDRARLAAVAVQHRVADRVRFVGSLPREQVPALLRSADLVVCVPWYEPFGMVPLEAMACARPVVASAVGGLADTVVDGITGVHVPPRRVSELTGALRRLLAAPALREGLGAAGRDRALARYGWDRVGAATVDVYDQVLARRPVAEAAR